MLWHLQQCKFELFCKLAIFTICRRFWVATTATNFRRTYFNLFHYTFHILKNINLAQEPWGHLWNSQYGPTFCILKCKISKNALFLRRNYSMLRRTRNKFSVIFGKTKAFASSVFPQIWANSSYSGCKLRLKILGFCKIYVKNAHIDGIIMTS